MMKIINTSFLLLVLLFANYAKGINTDSLCWQYFKQNKYTEIIALGDSLKYLKLSPKKSQLSISISDYIRGNREKALKGMLEYCLTTKDPSVYLYSFLNTRLFYREYSIIKQEDLKKLELFYNSKECNNEIKPHLAMFFGRYYYHKKQEEKANEYFKSIHAVTNFSIAGVFNNTSAGGFDNNYGPLNKPESNAIFTDNFGGKITWFQNKLLKDGGWVDMANLFDIQNKICFAQTFINSAQEQTLIMKVGVSGSLKLWINDKLVISNATEYNAEMDCYQVPVKLMAGNNRVLLQLGESELGMMNFLLRFTDVSGKSININSESNFTPYQKDNSIDTPISNTGNFAETYFTNKKDLSFEEQIVFAQLLIKNDKAIDAIEILQNAKKESENNIWISYLLEDCYGRLEDTLEVSIERSKRQKDRNIFFEDKLNYIADNKEGLNTETEMKEAIEMFGKTPEVYEAYYMRLIAIQQTNKIEEMMEIAIKEFPTEKNIVTKYFLAKFYSREYFTEAYVFATDYISKYNDEVVLNTVCNAYAEAKQLASLSHFGSILKLKFPYNFSVRLNLLNLNYINSNFNACANIIDELDQYLKYNATYLYYKSQYYLLTDDKSEAIGSLKQLINHSTNNYQAFDKLAELNGEKNLSDYFKSPNLNALVERFKKNKLNDEKGVIILNNTSKQIAYKQSGTRVEDNIQILVTNQSGVNTLKEYKLEVNKNTYDLYLLKANIIKPNGTIIKAEQNQDMLVFSGLEPMDIIDISLSLNYNYEGELAKNVFQNFYFESLYPTLYASYQIIYPTKLKINYNLIGENIIKDSSIVDNNYSYYSFTKDTLSHFELETAMPFFTELSSNIQLSSFSSWQEIKSWYSGLTKNKMKVEKPLKDLLTKIVDTKKTKLENVKSIYEYILKNINYSSEPFLHSNFIPQTTTRTLITHLGDCKDVATLFVTLCRQIGVEANLALVLTRDGGKDNLKIPTVSFNHCIAILNLNSENYFVELTDNNLPFASKTLSLQNAQYLLINDSDMNGIQTINFKNSNCIKRHSKISIENRIMKVVRKTIRTGFTTSISRYQFLGLSEQERKKSISESIGTGNNNVVDLEKLEFINLDNLEDTLKTNYTYNIADNSTTVSGLHIVNIPFTDDIHYASILSSEQRQNDLYLFMFNEPDSYYEQIVYKISNKETLFETPKNIAYTNKYLDYKQSFVIIGAEIKISRELVYKNTIIPKQDYKEFREMILKITEADKKPLVFKIGKN